MLVSCDDDRLSDDPSGQEVARLLKLLDTTNEEPVPHEEPVLFNLEHRRVAVHVARGVRRLLDRPPAPFQVLAEPHPARRPRLAHHLLPAYRVLSSKTT